MRNIDVLLSSSLRHSNTCPFWVDQNPIFFCRLQSTTHEGVCSAHHEIRKCQRQWKMALFHYDLYVQTSVVRLQYLVNLCQHFITP
jgi:hypothetical protein